MHYMQNKYITVAPETAYMQIPLYIWTRTQIKINKNVMQQQEAHAH